MDIHRRWAFLGPMIFIVLLHGNAWSQWSLQWSQAEYSGFIYYFDERSILLQSPDGGVVVKTGSIGFTTGRDIRILKYDDSGLLLWSHVWNGSFNGNDRAYNMDLDDEGNIFVVGSTQVDLNDDDAVVFKLDPDGELIWSETISGVEPGSDRAAALDIGSDGFVYIGGWLATNGTSSGRVMVAKIGSAGTLEWQIPLGSDEHWLRVMDAAIRVMDGNCRFLYGYWENSLNRYRNLLLSPTGQILTDVNGTCAEGSGSDAYAIDAAGNGYIGGIGVCLYSILKLTPDGVVQWSYVEPTNQPEWSLNDNVNRIVVDDNGHIYATGRHYGPDFNGPTYTSSDILTVMLDTLGNLIWSHRFNDQGLLSGEDGNGLHVTTDGHVLVSGYSSGPVPSESQDHLALLLSPEGELMTHINFDGYGADDCAWSITGSQGEMYLTGLSMDILGFAHTITQCYRLSTSLGTITTIERSMWASPNPFTEATVLRFNRNMPIGSYLEIHDTKGVLVGRWSVEGREQFLLPSTALHGNGVYVARVIANGSPQGTLRLVQME